MTKKEKPKVSVIMSILNGEMYLAESIKSILSQTFEDFEFIIMDDGSTDNTWKIVSWFANRDKRIVPVRSTRTVILPISRNNGIKLSRGKYIACQNSDDISLPKRLERHYFYLEENPDVGMVGGFLELFNEKGSLGVRKYPEFDKEIRYSIFRYLPVSEPASMMRKECFERLGGYSNKYKFSFDCEMIFRIGLRYKLFNLQEVVTRYRHHEGTLTFRNEKMMEVETLKIREKYSKVFPYDMSYTDRLFNYLQNLSIYLFPPKLKIWLFYKFRNTRLNTS